MLGKESESTRRAGSMSPIPQADRRQYPRVDNQLPMRISANGYDFQTNTHNISAMGAYCHIEKYIPPFTRLGLHICLPIKEHNGAKELTVECSGVVVRTEDDASTGGFNIAIYFDRIRENSKNKIALYLSQFYPQAAPVHPQ
jgi:hypothetical protein